jgi:sporulation protein YlmC with PRC-barrel domain
MARVEYIDYKDNRGSVVTVTLRIHQAGDRIYIRCRGVTLRFVSKANGIAIYWLRVAGVGKYTVIIKAIEKAANGDYELLKQLNK